MPATKPASKPAAKPATKNARPVTPAKKTSAPRSRSTRSVTVPQQRTVAADTTVMTASAAVSPAPAPYAAAPQWGPPAGWTPPPAPPRPGFFSNRAAQLVLVGVTSLVLGLVIGSTAHGSSKGNTNAVDPAAAASKPQPAAKAPTTHASTPAKKATAPKAAAPVTPQKAAAPTKPNDKGWVVQSLNVKNDGLGDFGGSARVTNTNDSSRTAVVTFTLFRNGHQVGVLQGSSSDVSGGKTVTVDLISSDKYSSGSYTYDFQADISY
jgi:hypothetical protein